MRLKFAEFAELKTVIVINLILAVVALLKDIVLASYLGTQAQADAFWLAFFIPDTAANLLGGSITTACIPVFARLHAAEDDRMKNTVTLVTLCFALGTLGLYLGLFFTRHIVIRGLGAGLPRSGLDLCLDLFVIMLPLILAFPLISVGTAMLQVHHRFNLPASAPVLFNVVLLSGVLYSYLRPIPIEQGVYLLAASVLTGTGLMMVLVWSGLRKNHLRIWRRLSLPQLKKSRRQAKEVIKVFFIYLTILLSLQAVYAVERYLASGLAEGSIAGLNYAFRIAQFPLWVFVAAVSTVAFPAMSRAIGQGRADEIKHTLSRALLQILIIVLPLTACLFLLRVPVVTILFQRGSFDAGSVEITAGVLAGYALSIVWQGIALICQRAFLAIGQALPVFLSFLFFSSLNILFDFSLVRSIGLPGLGYGAAVCAFGNALVLLYLLNRVLPLGIGNQAGRVFRILAANLLLLPVIYFFAWLWAWIGAATAGLALKMGYAAAAAAVGLLAYWLSLRVCGAGKILESRVCQEGR